MTASDIQTLLGTSVIRRWRVRSRRRLPKPGTGHHRFGVPVRRSIGVRVAAPRPEYDRVREAAMRVAVLGAGVFGAASALALAERGHRVVLHEAGTVPRPEAASTDLNKLVRMDYGADRFYRDLGAAAIDGWERCTACPRGRCTTGTGCCSWRRRGSRGLRTRQPRHPGLRPVTRWSGSTGCRFLGWAMGRPGVRQPPGRVGGER